jgi:DNA-directed RNA polymerase subunit RPC12/RpoP
MTTSTDETDQRHRYECDPCGIEGPLRNHRDRAARDAQQHDIGFHNGTITCEVVDFEVATDGGVDLVEACPECDGTKFKVRVSSVHKNLRTGDVGAKYKCGVCGATFDEPARRERRAPAPLNGTAKRLAEADPGDLLTDGGVPLGDRVQCPHCSASFPARRSARREANELDEHIAEAHGELVTDGGLERPPFVDPDVEVVECHFCHETWPPEMVDGFDLSAEDEYYPRMVPVCPEHRGGCR